MSKDVVPHSFVGDLIWAFKNWREKRAHKAQLINRQCEIQDRLMGKKGVTGEERQRLTLELYDIHEELESL
jgi:hypothetical protein